jgi:methylmalonyl-CoA/ethylmalonyl-CoA epimerase
VELEFEHIAVGVWRFEDAIPVAVEALGGRPGRGGPSPGFDWRTWVFAGGGLLEILQPTGPPDGFLHRFLRSRGPGVHHATFIVADLRAACDHVQSCGFRIVGYDDSDPGWHEAFIHPRQALGTVVQLGWASPEHMAEGYDWEPPPEQATAPDPVTLAGLRLSAPDAGEVLRLFQKALLGEVTQRPGEIVLGWPRSPMRIAVSIDASRPAGPLALEVETDREIGLLGSDAPETFGVPIRRVVPR